MLPHKFMLPHKLNKLIRLIIALGLALSLLCAPAGRNANAQQRKGGRRAPTTGARAGTAADKGQPSHYVEEGLRAAGEGRWADAIKAYRHALVDNPQDVEAYINLGDAYLSAAQDKEAIAAYQQAVRLAPQNADAQYALGAAYNYTGQNSDAFKPLVRAISLAPDYAEAYYGIGYAYQQLDNYKDAVGYLKNAVRLKPDYPEAYLALGLAYVGLGDLKTAEAQLATLQTQDAALAKELARAIDKLAGTTARANAQPSPPATQSKQPATGQRAPKQTETARTAPPATPLTIELSFWDSIKTSSDAAEYEAYLQKYPTGQFAELAKIRLHGLTEKKTAPSTPASAPPPSEPTNAPPAVESQAEPPVASAPPPAAQPTPDHAPPSNDPPAAPVAASTPSSEQPPEPDGPLTLEQTMEWIRKSLPAKFSYQATTPGETPAAALTTRTVQVAYELLRFEGCTLEWRDQADTLTVGLAALDPASVRVEPRTRPDTTFSPAVWNVSLSATSGQGAFHERKSDGAENIYNGIDLQYSDKATADRLARALQHAIKLCGGKPAPASS